MSRVFFRALSILLFCLAVFSSTALADNPCSEYLYPPGNSYGYFMPTEDGTVGLYPAIASKDGFAYVCVKGASGFSVPLLRCLELGPTITDPPIIRSQTGLAATTRRIVLVDGYAVLAMGSLGLGLVDISNPDIMPYVSLTTTGDVCRDLALLGSDHVVTAEWSALRIYDLQNPASPVEIAGVPLSQARTVAVEGDLAFVACGNLGLAIVDISSPSVPFLVTQIPVGGFVDQVAADGNRVYLTGYLVDLVTVDVTTPDSPIVAHVLPLEGEPDAIVIRGGYAYITVDEALELLPPGAPFLDAMALVQLNQAGTPALVDYFFPSLNYSSIALGDDLLLLGETQPHSDLVLARLKCLDLSDVPDSPSTNLFLSTPWPNPFNPRVNIRFSLPADLPGRLMVHDLRGNLIAEVWRGIGTGRETNAVWNGVDQAGRACPSGTYGFMLTDGAGRQSAFVTGTLLR